LKEKFRGSIEDFEFYFNLLYSLYSFPNIILPFIAGILIMKLGARFMFVFYSIFIALGQLLFALGVQYESILTMLFARIIFGFGGECLGICQNTLLIKWFFNSELAFPLGLTISIGRFGSVISDLSSPKIANVYFLIYRI
jgi:MFS family permease